METRKTSRLRVGNIIACAILVLVFVFVMVMYANAGGNSASASTYSSLSSEVIPLVNKDYSNSLLLALANQNEVEAGPKEEVIVERRTDLDDYITTYLDDIKFLCYTYSIDYEDFIDDLHKQYELNYETYGFNEKNVGYILNANNELKDYKNVKYGLVEYINKYIDKNPKKKKTRRVAYTGSASYVENLIRYYCTIYTDVDTNIALSIGAAESGYYKVKYMLKIGNIYGGMGKGGIIHYDNIEIGVLSYVRLLSRSYFGKGVNTINGIGYRYCPGIDNNGNKVASPHWVGLVNTAMKHYNKQDNKITASDLLKKTEVL